MKYDLDTHNFADPDPWVALSLDRSTFFEVSAKEALLRGNDTRSRQFLQPVLRPIARLSIVLVQLIRIVLPNSFTSTKLLHTFIVWGMKTFVQADANYLIIRHFNIGSQILKFITDNIPGIEIKAHPLKPRCIEDLRDNVFIQHDINIYNFIIQVSAQLNAQGREILPVPLEKINFSAIQDVDPTLMPMPRRWTNFMDLQCAIEVYTPVFALMLSDRDFWRSSNSLQLDETIALYIARIFNRGDILGLVNNKHPMVPISTLEAGYRLMLHGLDAENLYGFVRYMRDQQEKLAKAA
ncbi:MAG: hypothetical protein ACAH83_04140 [Alphaproteobacteria bacterium]